MKKILKNLCLCLCLVMVGMLCFNAKPKAALFGTTRYSIDLSFPGDYEDTSYLYGIIFSYTAINSQQQIYLNYYLSNNEFRTRSIFAFNNDSSLLVYNNLETNTLVNTQVYNVETSFFGLYITNIFVNGALRWNIRLIQFDYTKKDLIDDTDISSLSNAFTEIYNFNLTAADLGSLSIANSYSLYYLEYTDLDTFAQITGNNYLAGFYLTWMYYNSNIEGLGIGPYVSTFYNYSLDEFNKGVDEGLEIGFDLGVASIENIPGSFLTPIFDFIDNVFNLEVMPNVKIGYFIIIPLVFGVLGVVLYFWRKD